MLKMPGNFSNFRSLLPKISLAFSKTMPPLLLTFTAIYFRTISRTSKSPVNEQITYPLAPMDCFVFIRRPFMFYFTDALAPNRSPVIWSILSVSCRYPSVLLFCVYLIISLVNLCTSVSVVAHTSLYLITTQIHTCYGV